MTRHRSVRVGVAIGLDAIWVVPLRRRGQPPKKPHALRRPFERVPQNALSSTVIRDAFRAISEELHTDVVKAHVALLPDVAQGRRLELPRLSTRERRRVLTRYAGKYFLGVDAPQVVGTVVLPGTHRSPQDLFAVAASAHNLDAVFAAARDAGWDIEGVTSAYDAWVVGATTLVSGLQRERAWVVIARGDDEISAILTDGGRPAFLRRFPGGTVDTSEGSGIDWREVLASGRAGVGTDTRTRVCVVGAEAHSRQIADDVSACGMAQVDCVRVDGLDDGNAIAAAFAARTSGSELLPTRIHDERRLRSRRLTVRVSAVAAAIVMLAGALEVWGTKRELHTITERRAAIREQVDAAMAEREVLAALNDRLATLASLQQTAPQWSSVIANVAEHLPADAHLVAFRGAGDSLVLEGVADRAAGVFEAIQIAPQVLGVRAQAPIRRELQQGEGDRPIERFTLAARLVGAQSPKDPR